MLSRISSAEMPTGSPAERVMLHPNRLYIVVEKIKTTSGLCGAPSIKGDTIVCLQDGPAEALKLSESVGKLFFVVITNNDEIRHPKYCILNNC